MQANKQSLDLPIPSDFEQHHSGELCEFLRQQIAENQGRLDFASFMHHVLYAPGLGYYAAGATKFGASGDFVTAPEVCALFAQCLADVVISVLGSLGQADVLELGAGSGVLAKDLLLALPEKSWPEHYYILEPSAELQLRQQETLQLLPDGLLKRVSWLQQLPEQFNGMIIGNEVLDAMPVQRFRISDTGIEQAYVENVEPGFEEHFHTAEPGLVAAVEKLQVELRQSLPTNYVSEINLALPAWCRSMSQCLHKGAIVLIDYGYPQREYYLPERREGTLICHYKHHGHADPFFYPGLQDISAFVDFTALVEAMTLSGLDFEGYTSQAQFLIEAGISDKLLRHQAKLSETEYLRLAQQTKTLTLPGEMGERFKVMSFSKKIEHPVMGFSKNQNHCL